MTCEAAKCPAPGCSACNDCVCHNCLAHKPTDCSCSDAPLEPMWVKRETFYPPAYGEASRR